MEHKKKIPELNKVKIKKKLGNFMDRAIYVRHAGTLS